jgi:hypothetical protein
LTQTEMKLKYYSHIIFSFCRMFRIWCGHTGSCLKNLLGSTLFVRFPLKNTGWGPPKPDNHQTRTAPKIRNLVVSLFSGCQSPFYQQKVHILIKLSK